MTPIREGGAEVDGAFGAFEAGVLTVGPGVAAFAARRRLESAEALASWAEAFPAAAAEELGWTEPDVQRAVAAVWATLGAPVRGAVRFGARPTDPRDESSARDTRGPGGPVH